jgi:hypothetical protein
MEARVLHVVSMTKIPIPLPERALFIEFTLELAKKNKSYTVHKKVIPH